MKIEIFGDPEEEEKVLRLRLKRHVSNGSISLVAVDKTGEIVPRGSLLEFTAGDVYFFPGINEKLGLSLTSEGKWRTN